MSSGTSHPSQAEVDMRAREALITGKPPRIAPLRRDEVRKEDLEILTNVRKAAGLPPTDEIPEFVATLLRHPALYERHFGLGLQLYQGALSPRDRELAVLRVAWLCQAPFEWGEHVAIGKRAGGLSGEEIARVIRGSAASGWNEHDRAIIRAVEELVDEAMISDGTWAVLARDLDEQQLIELPLLVGQYQGVAYVQNSLRLRLIAGNPGLSAR